MRSAPLALVFALLIPATAGAHQKSVSYSKWTLVDGGAVVQVRVRVLELTSLPSTRDAADRSSIALYLQSKLSLETDAERCEPLAESTQWLPADEGWLRLEWQVRCDADATRLRSELFASLSNHVHLSTVLGGEPVDLVLSSTSPSAEIGEGAQGADGRGIIDYLRLGIEHIVSGWDHVAFLLLLVVVARRVREVALLVTGFTVGHSVTLAAASLGVVVPNARAVEATIAASILVVALENAGMERVKGGALVLLGALALFAASATFGGLPAFWGIALFTACYFALLRLIPQAGRLRWAVACLFGFVHGLGFSGVLLEQELPRGQLLQALFGFNVGVELGQLAIVALVWPLLHWLRNRERGDKLIDATSFAGAALGTFALVVRAFG